MKLSKIAAVAAGLLLAAISSAQAQNNPWAPGGKAERYSRWVEPTYKALDSASRVAPRVVPQQYRPHAKAFNFGWQGGKLLESKGKLGDRLYRMTGGK